MSLNFGQIPPLTTELAALERLKNRCHHVISVDIDPIFFKLAGNMDMHNIMNEFEFRPDRTTDYGVSCPWASKKYPYRPYNGENGVSTFSLLFLIESFWYFHVTRTRIKAWMSLNFLKWDLTLAHWTQVSDRCPLGYLFNLTYCAEKWRLFVFRFRNNLLIQMITSLLRGACVTFVLAVAVYTYFMETARAYPSFEVGVSHSLNSDCAMIWMIRQSGWFWCYKFFC